MKRWHYSAAGLNRQTEKQLCSRSTVKSMKKAGMQPGKGCVSIFTTKD